VEKDFKEGPDFAFGNGIGIVHLGCGLRKGGEGVYGSKHSMRCDACHAITRHVVIHQGTDPPAIIGEEDGTGIGNSHLSNNTQVV